VLDRVGDACDQGAAADLANAIAVVSMSINGPSS
jgi:hypothetical protein